MIKIENTLKTSVTYNGTGTQTRFDFPFDYLRKSFVYVSVNNALMNNTTDYTIDGRTVVFNTAPASGSVIRIYRETTTDRLVVWADASVLKAADMTIQQVQHLHILEEGQDWSKLNSIYLDEEDSKWQGNNHPMKNISDPVDAKDVVTKGYMESVQSGFVMTNTALKDEAAASASAAATSETNAASSANMAKRWAEASDSPDNTISKSAKTWAEEAKDARDEAKDTAVNLGNPVVNITENNGTVTVTKSNGTQSTFMAFPQGENGALPIAKGGTGATTAKQARENLEVEPIGTIFAFAGNNIPTGYLPCNGSAISRETYADLFAVIGTTYGSGDGSTTFNLPNLTNKFIQGSDTAGTVKSAGLPNITGTKEYSIDTVNSHVANGAEKWTGAFARDKNGSKMTFRVSNPWWEDEKGARTESFDASRCSSIYGNSTTVQPPALTMRYIIKY